MAKKFKIMITMIMKASFLNYWLSVGCISCDHDALHSRGFLLYPPKANFEAKGLYSKLIILIKPFSGSILY